MAGFLGGFFSSIGRMLPGYLEGERQAVQDNWSDLSNYNKVQEGQLNNAFTEETFGDRADMMRTARNMSVNNMEQSYMNLDVNRAAQQARMQNALAMSAWAPMLSNLIAYGQYGQANAAARMYNSPEWTSMLLRSMRYGGSTGGTADWMSQLQQMYDMYAAQQNTMGPSNM